MTAHSKLGASSMYRWSVCPGSVQRSIGFDSASSWAEEGSDAHAFAAYCFVRNFNPWQGIGQTISYDGRTFDVEEEMAEAVNVYTTHCYEDAKKGDIDYTEHRFDLSAIYPGCFGTCDRVTWRPSESLLIVRDYKHGAGIFVSAVNNPQLKYYGLGALLTLKHPVKRVRLEIIQPRCDGDPVRFEEIDALDLVDFATDLKTYALATEAPDAPLVPGEHCRFCPAAATNCPAIRERAMAVAKTEFSPVLSYSPEKLRFALDNLSAIEAYVKNVREFAYAEAEAGRCPPGYKLVAKRANRKWADEASAEGEIRSALGAQIDVFEPRALLSPAKIEKVKGVKKGQFDSLTVKESSGHTLVALEDPRPSVKLSAREEFVALPPPV